MHHQTNKVGTPSHHGHCGHDRIDPVKVSQDRNF